LRRRLHFRPAHKIFILDAFLEDLLDESDPHSFSEQYFGELLFAIKMKPLAPLSVSPATDSAAPGFSGMQELTTSHTSFHYFWEPGRASPSPNVHIDLYSCAPFASEDVLRIAHQHFRLTEWVANYVERSLELSERLILQLQGKGDRILEQTVLSEAQELVPARRALPSVRPLA
jgi:S-adenosylmethionine/arginine decarboxylase-like enzyme